ncbi:MAG: four helix bundle protein [Deltaproteobacteria bacterium]|nr:four helix bundle protein [Deltaproteobacteria bacterium]
MSFRFKGFRVYVDSKEFCKFCREQVRAEVTDKNLADQIQRALNSIVLNIAEGSADNSDVEFARFLGISIRSVYETVAGFDLAESYGMVGFDLSLDIENRAEKLVKQLSAFRSSLANSHKL